MSQQIQTDELFSDVAPDNALTGAKLTNAFASQEILSTLITDQTAATPAVSDYLLIYHASSADLRKMTITTLMNTSFIKDPVSGAGPRTLGTGAAQAAAGDDARFAPIAPVAITLSVGAGTGDCSAANAVGKLFTVALPTSTTACTVTLNNIPDGALIILKTTQGSSSASTLTITPNSGNGSGALTKLRVGGAGDVTGSTNAIDTISIYRFGTTALIEYKNAYAA